MLVVMHACIRSRSSFCPPPPLPPHYFASNCFRDTGANYFVTGFYIDKAALES